MEEMHMVRYGGKGTKLPCPLQVPLSQKINVFATLPENQCVCQPGSSPNSSFQGLWRLHYIGMIDELIATDLISSPSL